MKNNIHPNYTAKAQVTCACGSTFTIGSILSTLQVDICSKCHPFFTGEMKFVDRQGRVDKFFKKVAAAEAAKATKKTTKKKVEKSAEDAQSYKDILRDQQTTLKQKAKSKKAETTHAKSVSSTA